jgi:hypothetical protein
MYTVVQMIRRILMIFILFVLFKRPWLQGMLLIKLSLIQLMILIHLKPYKDKLTNRFEIINELTIFINTHLQLNLIQETNEHEDKLMALKGKLGYIVISNIVLNIIINIATVGTQSFIAIYRKG